jgi:hypothetical protein
MKRYVEPNQVVRLMLDATLTDGTINTVSIDLAESAKSVGSDQESGIIQAGYMRLDNGITDLLLERDTGKLFYDPEMVY